MVLSSFHPTIRTWFERNLGSPTPPQQRGWPRIQAGAHVLIAAPTGSGKTLTAFLSAIDSLLQQGESLTDSTQVLYVSPLKALSNDIAKNLAAPLAELRALDETLPEIRVSVRTGDTLQKERAAMVRRNPHILVTTPESLYVLLTSSSGRRMLRSVRTVIVDEIHALARDKRGAHLALSLERLEALAPKFQRIGLSATQRPLERIASFLGGVDRDVEVIDGGHLRHLDLGIELPRSLLSAVCSHEVWEEVYQRIAELVAEHRTTLIFVNTRKLAERVSVRLAELLGPDLVRCHHGSLSRAIRLEAESMLKDGKLRALVATASLELGIDIGDVDLAMQLGSPRSIANFLQRMGRAGHGVGRIPKGRVFPLTRDELVESAALLKAVKDGHLDQIRLPDKPLDILAQQMVAACVAQDWDEKDLYERLRRAWPYRDLGADEFEATAELHLGKRGALLHRDGVNGRLMATPRARLRAVMNGGAIPDLGDYRVILEPEGSFVGTLTEDFAIESQRGDVFQLGSTSWKVLRVEANVVRVADAKGAPPTIPFWNGEAPGRTFELSQAVAKLRERFVDKAQLIAEYGLDAAPAAQIAEYLEESRRVLGALPTQSHLIVERFFDESGGTQIVLHSPFGSRINRALGYALRKRICVGFGFELQSAAGDDAIVFSLGEKPGVPFDEIFDFLNPDELRDLLAQALLPTPIFGNRWRWNATRSLLVERMNNGKPVPVLLQRMKATDLLTEAFPDVVACAETLASPVLDVPMSHPLVRQTMIDCQTETLDVDGCIELVRDLRAGRITRAAVDTPQASPLAHEIIAARPYAFLDDAPLEERRTRAVMTRHVVDRGEVGALDPEAIRIVKEQAWPQPRNAEELHEALTWMGFVTVEEAKPWAEWVDALIAGGRLVVDGGRIWAAESDRDPLAALRGRMEALGPVHCDDPDERLLLESLAAEGAVLKIQLDGKPAWCNRRLLQRIQRHTLERLRKEIEPVSAAQLLRFLACWQYADPGHRREGPKGVAEVLARLAGFEVPAREWEQSILPRRVKNYRREWLDQVTLSGEFAFGRLFGGGHSPIKTTPIAFVPRRDLPQWLALTAPPLIPELSETAKDALDLLAARGAVFPDEMQRALKLLPSQLEAAVAELIAHGAITADSFGVLRSLLVPPSERTGAVSGFGRFSRLRGDPGLHESEPSAEFVARALLQRTGVVFRKTIERERQPIFWRDLLRVYRSLELKGEVRGGRFVAGFDGEQYALEEAVVLLRSVRKREDFAPVEIDSADPLNFEGILTPRDRVAANARETVAVL